MTNIEKVKRILDAGHWVKVTYPDTVYIQTITSYCNNEFSYTDSDKQHIYTVMNPTFQDCTIEVIQRIPTAYKAGDKVIVLSNPTPENRKIEDMVGKVCEVYMDNGYNVCVLTENKVNSYYFPRYCLSPVFEEDSLSGKEAKVTIDGKEYTCVIK